MDALPSIDEALAAVLDRVRPLALERVPAQQASGRVLAEDARAAVDLPPFESSAMDGFAVVAADTPGRLAVAGDSAAGRPFAGTLAPGAAVAISTGAVVPDGADAVVPVEHAVVDGRTVTLERVDAGANVRARGGDVRAGDVVLAAGAPVGPPQVAALAAAGVAFAGCRRRPRVSVLATGTELRAPGEPLGPGEIYESNTALLAAQVATAGAVADVMAAVADDVAATRAALERALEADVVVTSGGVSVGEHDLVRATLAALVGFELFVRPALLALQGAREPAPAYLPGRLGRALRRNPARDELVRARTVAGGDAVTLEPVGGQESHMIVRAAAADALVLVPRGEGELPERASVRYLRI